MNTLTLKKIGIAILLGLCFTSNAIAQSTPPAPGGGPAALPSNLPTPPTPTAWAYLKLPSASTITPTIEMNSTYYLPYLPWIGQNLYVLASYANSFYQMQQNDLTNSGLNSPYTLFNAGTLSGNNILSSQMDSNAQASSNKTSTELQTNFTFFPGTSSASQASNIPGTDICVATSDSSSPCYNPQNTQFNADILIGSTGFTADTRPHVDTLISFLGNLNTPLPNPGFKSTDTQAVRNDLLKRADMQAFIVGIRSVAALQSMALSNFNMLAQERQIIPGLGKNIGMTTFPNNPKDATPINDASQLEVDKFLIDRRVNNSAWYDSMNHAPSLALQRETVFLLAEMQRQLYQLRMLNERMLATMSTMQMAMLQLSNSGLNVQAQNIKSSLSAQNNPPTPPPS